jgi:hypothetical protein
MNQVVVKTERLFADRVIVAAGAGSPELLEGITGTLSPYRRVYRQYPRIGFDKRLPFENSRVALPVIQAAGFSFRPHGEGLMVVPPVLAADPEAYEPEGTQLMGVRVGLRREVLELVLEATHKLPVFTWDSLDLGKTVQKVRGCWQLYLEDPEWRQLSESCFTLLGGEQGYSLGLTVAYDLAASLAGLKERPWLAEAGASTFTTASNG